MCTWKQTCLNLGRVSDETKSEKWTVYGLGQMQSWKHSMAQIKNCEQVREGKSCGNGFFSFPHAAGVGSCGECMQTNSSLGLEINIAATVSNQIFTQPVSCLGHSLCWSWTCGPFGRFSSDRGIATGQTDASSLTCNVVLQSPK